MRACVLRTWITANRPREAGDCQLHPVRGKTQSAWHRKGIEMGWSGAPRLVPRDELRVRNHSGKPHTQGLGRALTVGSGHVPNGAGGSA